jgi:hypothetical protein
VQTVASTSQFSHFCYVIISIWIKKRAELKDLSLKIFFSERVKGSEMFCVVSQCMQLQN